MFAKSKISQSMIDAVNSVITEDKKRLINDAEMDETGFHKAAHAAKKAGQSHFEFQGKKYPATAKSHKEAIEMDEASEKVPTSTGMKVYGSSYGNSMKARKDQTKHSVDDVKGPKTKELKAMDKEPKKNLDEDGNCVTPDQAKKIADKEVGKHEKGMHKGKKGTIKEGSFAEKLLNIYEAKSSGTEEIFTDNNLGEEEMTDAQKKKREKIVMSMKKGEAGMKQRYGKNWKNVMYATATKQAMKEDSSDEWEGEQLDEKRGAEAMKASGIKQSPDKLLARTGMNMAHKFPRKGQTNLGNIPAMNTPGNSPETDAYAEKRRGDRAKELKPAIKSALGTHGPKGKLPEEVELDEASPAKNQDVADKAYLKHKPGTVKGTMTQLGRFLKGKPEIKESNDSHTHAAHYENDKGEWTGMNLFTAKDDDDAIKQAQAKCKEGCKLSKVERHTTVKEDVEVVQDKNAARVTTDMLSGRVEGGKLNSFKNFKVNLVTSGEETIATEVDKGEDTKEKQKITTNPGPVNIKLDDKLATPPHEHFSSEHQITHEEVQMDEKVIDGMSGFKKMSKDVKDKSGAVHTPMSRAKDLARQSLKKLKKETMMGKISN